jgi:hypothetical protein
MKTKVHSINTMLYYDLTRIQNLHEFNMHVRTLYAKEATV